MKVAIELRDFAKAKFSVLTILILCSTMSHVYACFCLPDKALKFLSVDTTGSSRSNCYGRLSKTVIIKGVVMDLNAGDYLHSGEWGGFRRTQVVTLKILEFWPECGLIGYYSDTISVLVGPTGNGCTTIPNLGDTCLVYGYNPNYKIDFEDKGIIFTTTRTCGGFFNFAYEPYKDIIKEELDSLGEGFKPKPDTYLNSKYRGPDNRIKSDENTKSLNATCTNPQILYLLLFSALINLVLVVLYFYKGK